MDTIPTVVWPLPNPASLGFKESKIRLFISALLLRNKALTKNFAFLHDNTTSANITKEEEKPKAKGSYQV